MGAAALVTRPEEWLLPGSAEATERPRWDAETVHEAMGEHVPYALLKEKSVPPPDNWHELLGGSDTGIVANLRYHRAYLFKDGRLIGTKVISSGARPTLATPSGVFHIGRQEGPEYLNFEGDPMPYSSFFHNGAAFHGSTNFKDARGRVARTVRDVATVRLDSSHGCINMLESDAQEVHDTYGPGTPVYVMPYGLGEEATEGLVEQTYTAEQAYRAVPGAEVNTRAKTLAFFNRILPSLPPAHDVAISQVREGVYGPFAPDARASELNPVIRLREAGLLSNGVRISRDTLAFSVRGQFNTRRGEGILSKHPHMPVQPLNWERGETLNAKWATIFGYRYDGDGQGWVPVHVAGLLMWDTPTSQLLLITKDSRHITEGAPMYTRERGGEFKFNGMVRKSVDLGSGLYAHVLYTAEMLPPL